jgi:toxin-antitoxin system PIN domain toxin
MPCLADVNILLAIIDSAHAHHAQVRSWFEKQGSQSVYLCRLTHLALLRLLTNPAVMRNRPLSSMQACGTLDALMDDPRAGFLPEPEGVTKLLRSWTTAQRVGAASWTDAYLAAFSVRAELGFATLEKGALAYPAKAERILYAGGATWHAPLGLF